MVTRVTPEEVATIHRLYTKYGTYAAVARETGRSASTVARYIKLKTTPTAVKIGYEQLVKG